MTEQRAAPMMNLYLCQRAARAWAVLLGGVVLVAAGSPAQVFYVSPSGSDTAPGTQSAPFRTPAAAQSAVRGLLATATEDITVWLAGGLYRLDAPLV